MQTWNQYVEEGVQGIEAGFDLTSMKASDFQKVLTTIGFDDKAGVEKGKNSFIWKGKTGVTVVTGNNPFTGKTAGGNRQDEKDYLSYVGISGKDSGKELFQKVVKMVKSLGNYKDFNPSKRVFI